MAQNDKNNRMFFLEDVTCPPKADTAKPAQKKDSQLQAMYDFDGEPSKLPSYTRFDTNGYPMELKASGEVKYELLKRGASRILRIIATTLIIALIILGAYCEARWG